MEVLKHDASTCSTVIFSAPRLCDFEIRYGRQGTDLSKMILITLQFAVFYQQLVPTQILCEKVILYL